MSRLLQLIIVLLRIVLTKGTDDKKRALFREFRELGGVYVKFLQILGVNQRFMAGWSRMKERMVYEDNLFEPIDLAKELGSHTTQFASIDSQPFAAGSFAVVYRAQLVSGEQVVLKILRPSVRRTLETDLKILRWLSRFMQHFMSSSIINLSDAFAELERTTRFETDYIQEADNALWFYDYYADNESVFIPYTYKDISSNTVIVQQFVGGVSLAQVAQLQVDKGDAAEYVRQATGSDIWAQLTTVNTESLKTALVGDYIFADPHPGNIKLLADNKIGLIDFGMVVPAPINREPVYKLTQQYQKLFHDELDMAEFTLAMMEYFDQRLVSSLDRTSRQMTDVSLLDKLVDYVDGLLKDHNLSTRYAQQLRDRRIATLFNSVLNEGNRFGVKADPKIMMIQRAMLMQMSMTGSICRPAGMDVYNAVIRDSLDITLAYVAIHGLGQSTVEPLSDEEAYDATLSWIGTMAEKNPLLVQQIGVIL